MNSATKLMLSILVFAAAALSLTAQAQEAEKLKQFVYVLRVAPALQNEKLWGDAEKNAAAAHFARMQKATKAGQVILAGRTTESLDKTFGMVIFKAENHEAAERFMNEDPAVVAKLMTATLHPFTVVLQTSTPAVTSLSSPRVIEKDYADGSDQYGSGRRSNAFFRSRCFAIPE